MNVNGSDWMGRYIIKREYSEGASNIFDLTLPQLGPISTSSDDMQLHQGHYSADVVPSAPMRSHADPPHAGIRECSSDQTHTSQQLGFVLSFAKAAASKLAHLSSFLFHSAPSSISAKPGTCQAEAEVQPLGGQSSNFGPTIHPGIGPDLAGHNTADSISCSTGERPPKNGSWAYPGLQLPAELKNLLAETADKLLHHSCGEGWLVQPRIANMSHLEYRVYLLGGASAVSARVFPFSHNYHSWLRMDVYVNVQHAFQHCAVQIAMHSCAKRHSLNKSLLLAICSLSTKHICIIQSRFAQCCQACVQTFRLLVNHFDECSCSFQSL